MAAALPELALDATLERETAPKDASHQHAVLSLVAPACAGDRAPVNLVAVLDRSGSMGGEKLRLVLATMRFMLQHLKQGDQLGLVSYDTHVRTDCPLTFCDEVGKQRLEQALKQIHAGSCTNLSGGLLEGLALHGRRDQVMFGNTVTHAQGPFGIRMNGYANRRSMQRMPLPPPPMQQTAQQMPMMQQAMPMMQQAVPAVGPPGMPCMPPPPPGASADEWAMELRCPAGIVQSVQYTLPGGEVVHAIEAPFRVARTDQIQPGTKVKARVTLASGAVVELEHEVQSRTAFRPLKLPGVPEPPAPPKGIVRSTLLFTDGLANEGIQDTEGICAAARAALGETDAKSTIHTFGFGADHNAEMLRAIAQVADGEYYYIESQDNVADSFGEAIGGLLSTTHQNIQLVVAVAPGVQLEPLTTFPHEADGPETTITLGDLFAEERRDVLVRFAVPAGAERAALAQVRVKAYSLAKQAFVDLGPLELAVGRADGASAGRADVLKHVNRHLGTTAMDAARQLAARGDLAAARQTVQKAKDELQATLAAMGECALTAGLIADLQDCLDSMQREAEYRSVGSKKLACMSKMHGKQRACAYEQSSATAMYAGSAQKAMKSAFQSSIR